MIKKSTKKLDQLSLKIIVTDIKKIALLLLGFVLGTKPTSCIKTSIRPYLVNIKVVADFAIFFRLTYWNNSNCLSLFTALYLYSTSIKVDVITL